MEGRQGADGSDVFVPGGLVRVGTQRIVRFVLFASPEAGHGVGDAALFDLFEFGLEPFFGFFGFVLFCGGFVLFRGFRGCGAARLELLNGFGISAFRGTGVAFELVEDAALVLALERFDHEAVGGLGVEVADRLVVEEELRAFDDLVDGFGFPAGEAFEAPARGDHLGDEVVLVVAGRIPFTANRFDEFVEIFLGFAGHDGEGHGGESSSDGIRGAGSGGALSVPAAGQR